ncbi:methyltransferase domain-containing protein [candidate division KSB1 bacterium]|nr:methyltransferase domain-containing protein [candidate division KSB1 bacterium]
MSLSLHTNLCKWQAYQTYALERGQLIHHLLQPRISLTQAKILDYGCGSGGTALTLARAGASVDAVDIDSKKLDRINRAGLPPQSLNVFFANELDLSTRIGYYDAIVLQDTLEHLPEPLSILKKLRYAIKANGWLFISTPNRLSPINWLADPHYGLPAVALLPRHRVKAIVADRLKWRSPDKPDFPQLFSLKSVHSILIRSGFSWQLVMRQAVSFALQNPRSMWNHPWHLLAVHRLDKLGAKNLLTACVNDRPGAINRWLMPTWFLLARADR